MNTNTGEMCRGGTIKATHEGRLIIERDSGHHTTISVDVGQAARVDFWPAGRSTKAHIEIHRDDARGWVSETWGNGVRVEVMDPSHEALAIEYSAPRAHQTIRVTVLEPYEAQYAIREARAMLERCGKILEAVAPSGGRPVEALLADLRREAYIE